MTVTGVCVVERTGGKFTLLDDYEITDINTVRSDDGHTWWLHNQGDGYVGCSDENGNEILSFLIE